MRLIRFTFSLCFLLLPSLGAFASGEGFYNVDSLSVCGGRDSLRVSCLISVDPSLLVSGKADHLSLAVSSGDSIKVVSSAAFLGKSLSGRYYKNPEHRLFNGSDSVYVYMPDKFRHVLSGTVGLEEWMDTVDVVILSERRGLLGSDSGRNVLGRYSRPDDVSARYSMWSVPEVSNPPSVCKSSIKVRMDFRTSEKAVDLTYGTNRRSVEELTRKISYLTSGDVKIVSSSLSVNFAPVGNSGIFQQMSKSRASSLFSVLKEGGAFVSFSPKVVPGKEDWEGLSRVFLRTTASLDPDFDRLFTVKPSSDAAYRKLVKKHSYDYDRVLKTEIPSLCVAVFDFSFRYRIPGSLDELLAVYESCPELLTDRDYVSLLSYFPKGSDEWFDILLSASRNFPDSGTFGYSMAMAFLDRGLPYRATVYLRELGGDDARFRDLFARWSLDIGMTDRARALYRDLSESDARYKSLYDNIDNYLLFKEQRFPWSVISE